MHIHRSPFFRRVVLASIILSTNGLAARGNPSIGDVTQVTHDDQSVTLTAGSDRLIARICGDDMVCVSTIAATARAIRIRWCLIRNRNGAAGRRSIFKRITIRLFLRTGRLTMKIGKHPCRVSFYDAGGRELFE